MVNPFLRIVRRPYEEPYLLNLIITASNGPFSGELEIYADATDLSTLARDLVGFPSSSRREVTWELGSDRAEDNFAHYFRLRIHQVTPTGKCAVELLMNNNRTAPDRQTSEFSIEAYPADLDRLASLLERFSRLEHTVLDWHVTSGGLGCEV